MGYFPFDTETTGVEFYDQIIELFGVHLLRETPAQGSPLLIDDKVGPLRCRLLPNRVPSPKALQVNGLSLRSINRARLTEYELTGLLESRLNNYSRIERLMPTAYNLKFDERMLRMANFRSLRAPNALRDMETQRIAFCTLQVARVASRLQPDQYVVPAEPANPSGVSFRQGQYVRANGMPFPPKFEHSSKHDVEDGTVAIMQMLRTRSPEVWDMMVQTADTTMHLSRIKRNQQALYVHVGSTNNLRPLTCCTILGFRQANETGKRSSPHALVFDLSFDPNIVAGASEDQWLKWYEMAVAIPAPEGGNTGPLRLINLRSDHFMVPIEKVATLSGLQPPVPMDVLRARHHTALQKLPAIAAPFVAKMTADLAFPDIPKGSPIESYLFTRDRDAEPTTDLSNFVIKSRRADLRIALGRFHEATSWEERADMLPSLKKLSPRAFERALSLVGEHAFQHLDFFAGDAQKYVERLEFDLEDPRSSYRTFPMAMAEAEELIKKEGEEHRAFHETTLSELHAMRSAKQRFYKTWEKQHQVPPTRDLVQFTGSATPLPGQTIAIKIT